QAIHAFLDDHRDTGYEEIDAADPDLIALEGQLRKQRQYLQVADLIRMKVLFASSTCTDLFGLSPAEIHIGTFFSRTHPDDQARHNLGRSKTLNMAQTLFIRKEGVVVHSSHFRQPDRSGNYIDVLFQAFLFHASHPYDTVYMAMVLTDLSSLQLPKHGYHYYLGNDLSQFRYPDEALMALGHVFSDREFEILQWVAKGLDSDRIAEKLYLSVHTVNTHRRNILKKTGTTSTHELVIELKEMGVL
ncbi:MAG: hypothetical protein EHM43_00075, partial [Ignavibacteriae bacterium]